ncbi:S-adenosyl-L-methionine-dependent tRNA 4-demethylwyosine synthase TYW1-like [Pecten maximus]|uniref:S-adenosyl-L-methionine-dependent tRNA 4-demethylwyosine synthase TYW1-like n=1 Tax=Pecten maximus TaxID=6579 RepID=UPI0014580561|nr:S-adenosyl-L-methionine-dependent tRNA 4-demethylwyosine synthase TYW1-like [Pecten maximus]
MLEKILTATVSKYIQLPVWTVALATGCLVWLLHTGRKRLNTKKGYIPPPETEKADPVDNILDKTKTKQKKLKVLYGTQTGKSKTFAGLLANDAERKGFMSEIQDLKDYDPEDTLAEEADDCYLVVIISTYTDGQPPEGSAWFLKWLQETASDFRVQKTLLKDLNYAVFGLGNSLYKENFCVVGKKIDSLLHQLSGNRIVNAGIGDENVADSKHGGTEADFDAWRAEFWRKMKTLKNLPFNKKSNEQKKTGKCSDGDNKCGGKCQCKTSGEACSSEEELYETTSEEEDEEDEEEVDEDGNDMSLQKSNGVVDVEDLGKVMKNMKKAKVRRKREDLAKGSGEPKEMVTPALRKALEKQGYRLIGSHSGVKLCRWTKSMLRGRGGCYKHTFYGIESHRCMETTPSLACANKCVFCWRHHTNPVGTEWRWKMDDAKTVIEGAILNHRSLIKQFKGVPGVLPERLQEGHDIKHCALSLVGEPIMYPEINKFVDMLHDKGISSFLVTNAQFPDAIKNMSPVTQLYVSVDASTKESLKKIDRPLFRDFWDRFLESLVALGEKRQRTVYRLTLVKAWNTEEIENYAKLVNKGKPDFIEVKGVTYCGESKASTLTMENVPWHEEVIRFVKILGEELEEYEIASEHEHSNCLLMAHKKFKVKGEWWTWIDYEKFHKLVQAFKSSNGQETFSAEDYMAKTPAWAVFGAKGQGFDPTETRFHRKKKKDIGGC